MIYRPTPSPGAAETGEMCGKCVSGGSGSHCLESRKAGSWTVGSTQRRAAWSSVVKWLWRCSSLIHGGVYGECKYMTHSFGTRWKWVASFTPRPLYPRVKSHGTHRIRGWLGPEHVWSFWRRVSWPFQEPNACIRNVFRMWFCSRHQVVKLTFLNFYV
jgi:hypothetical protein